MNTPTPKQFCKEKRPCAAGREFALLHPTMAEAWKNCPRPEWLLWALGKLKVKVERKTLRLFAVWCARNTPLPDGRKTGDLLKDPRSLAALEVAERYAHGNATDNELRAAEAAALDAAWSAALAEAEDAAEDEEWSAAWSALQYACAAWAAAAAAAADEAEDAVRSAAWCAAWAAARARSAARARAAAWSATWALDAAEAAQADQLRKMISNPFAQGGRK